MIRITDKNLQERQTPTRPSSIESDVIVPASQALFSAIVVTSLAAIWIREPTALAAIFAAVTAAAWFLLLTDTRRLLRTVERYITDAAQQQRPLRLEINTGNTTKIAHLPADHRHIRALAEAALNGKPLTERHWTGSGKPFTKREFREIRAELIRAGILRWRNQNAPAQGVIVTEAGREALQQILTAPPQSEH